MAGLSVVFEKLFNVTTSLRRPRGLRIRLHLPPPEAPTSASLPTHLKAEGPRLRVGGTVFLPAASFLKCPGQARPPTRERSPWRSGWTNCFSAAEIGPGEPASSLIHRGPTLTRVPEKWIRWLVNRGEGFFEAGTRRQIGHVAEEAPQDTVNMVERMKVARCVSS